jgi:hypothetical protein
MAYCREPKVCLPRSPQVCTVEKIRSRNLSPRPEQVENESVLFLDHEATQRPLGGVVGRRIAPEAPQAQTRS